MKYYTFLIVERLFEGPMTELQQRNFDASLRQRFSPTALPLILEWMLGVPATLTGIWLSEAFRCRLAVSTIEIPVLAERDGLMLSLPTPQILNPGDIVRLLVERRPDVYQFRVFMPHEFGYGIYCVGRSYSEGSGFGIGRSYGEGGCFGVGVCDGFGFGVCYGYVARFGVVGEGYGSYGTRGSDDGLGYGNGYGNGVRGFCYDDRSAGFGYGYGEDGYGNGNGEGGGSGDTHD